jgi:hypothetical protein
MRKEAQNRPRLDIEMCHFDGKNGAAFFADPFGALLPVESEVECFAF